METASTMVFRLTTGQRRRSRIGWGGVAAILWSVGVVRLAVTDKLTSGSGVVAVVALAVVLAAAAVVVSGIQPVVVLTDDAVQWRWGPQRGRAAWTEVDDVELRERGVARRVVLHTDAGHRVLPVPLTGGSILSPGADPDLDEKVEMIRTWWRSRRSS